MTRIRKQKQKPPTLTPEQRAEDDDLSRFCHAAAVRLFEMLDREEAEAGLPDAYSCRRTRHRRIKDESVKSVVKAGGVEK